MRRLCKEMALTLVDERETQRIFQVTGPDRQPTPAAKDWYCPEWEVSAKIAADFYYDIFLSARQLTVEAACDPIATPMPCRPPGALAAPCL